MNPASDPDAALRLGDRVPDERLRLRAAVNPTTPPEILTLLAQDRSLMVRAAVAMNDAVPLATARVLARDADEHVRAVVARKLAALAPWLAAEEQEALQREAFDALAALAADEAVRVRAALSDVVKQMPSAPRALILALAHDEEESVAEPIIRFSPLLTDQDLLLLLAAPPASGTALAVARRPDLTEPVSDAVAATASVGAIGALLANKSAAIRETTLDALIARAAAHVDWHEPLIRRPALSPASALELSRIVATHHLELLALRADLGAAVMADLARRLPERHLNPSCPGGSIAWEDHPAEPTGTPPAAEAVTETMVLQAARQGEAAVAVRLLAAAAHVPVETVQRAASLRSAKGLLSLVWKAGFTMQAAGPVQALLARVAPGALLAPDAEGGFPLTREEMRWQLEFLSRVSG